MVAVGYPAEIQDDLVVRWLWWTMAMLHFSLVVSALVSGMKSQDQATGAKEGLPLCLEQFRSHGCSWLPGQNPR